MWAKRTMLVGKNISELVGNELGFPYLLVNITVRVAVNPILRSAVFNEFIFVRNKSAADTASFINRIGQLERRKMVSGYYFMGSRG